MEVLIIVKNKQMNEVTLVNTHENIFLFFGSDMSKTNIF
jgi:hypothetical protein